MSDFYLQDDQTIPLTFDVFVGPNCDIEFKAENGEVGLCMQE